MAIPGATRYLQHWILAALAGLRVHAARLVSSIKVPDDLYIQFSKINEVGPLCVLEVPLHKGMNGKCRFYGSSEKISKNFRQ